MYLTRSAEAPARARAFVRQMLGATRRDVVDTTELLVSELVTNAVQHTTAARVRVDVDPGHGAEHGTVRVAVHDPVPPTADLSGQDAGGLGLGIVEELSTRWGVDDLGSGKRVWFEIAS